MGLECSPCEKSQGETDEGQGEEWETEAQIEIAAETDKII